MRVIFHPDAHAEMIEQSRITCDDNDEPSIPRLFLRFQTHISSLSSSPGKLFKRRRGVEGIEADEAVRSAREALKFA